MHRMTTLSVIAAATILPAHAQIAEETASGTSQQTVSVASTYARGEPGYAAAMDLLARRLRATNTYSDKNWMSKLDLKTVDRIEVIYARTVPKPAPGRFVLESTHPDESETEPGDQWSARICKVFAETPRDASVQGPYDLTWNYIRDCRDDACGWHFASFAMIRADSCAGGPT